MKTSIILLALLITFTSCNSQKTQPVIIDGQFENNEWSDARKIKIDDKNVISIKETDTHYYVAIKSELPKPLYIDMFFKIENTIFNIHASSQLGDRVLTDTSWTDYQPETLWGQNKGWTANTVKFDHKAIKEREANHQDPYADTFMPYQGMEFEFEKQSWQLEGSIFRIEIRNMIGPQGFKTVVFPASSKRKDTSQWFHIKI